MRSKEEILYAKHDAWLYIDAHEIDGSVSGVLEAMDEYAKEVVLDFMNWFQSKTSYDGKRIDRFIMTGVELELYKQYKKENQ